MVITFFSIEKMLQNYNKYLTYANKLLFFLPERRIFAHKVYYYLCCNAKNDAKLQ